MTTRCNFEAAKLVTTCATTVNPAHAFHIKEIGLITTVCDSETAAVETLTMN